MSEPKFAPREIFNQILEWSVIPTFDLVLEYGNGIIIVKRKIAPYKDQWALPGLRMLKGEKINDTLKRIARREVGLKIDPDQRIFLGQYTAKFKTEHQRQDLSTGFRLKVDPAQTIKLNQEHFFCFAVAQQPPEHMGSMYKYYFKQYLAQKE